MKPFHAVFHGDKTFDSSGPDHKLYTCIHLKKNEMPIKSYLVDTLRTQRETIFCVGVLRPSQQRGHVELVS